MSTLALHSTLYKEHLGNDHLSRTFESGVVFTPNHVDRPTIQEENYQRYRMSTNRTPKTPWGRSYSYGGLGSINLPADHRSKQEPPTKLQRGHQHYGSGIMPHARGLPIQQYYTITPLSRSKVRSTDQLAPKPTEEYLGKVQVTKKFPAEHPYASHISRYRMFPSYDSPDDIHKGTSAIQSSSTLPVTSPAKTPDAEIIGKTKGAGARHEIVPPPRSSERKQLEFAEGPNYYQLMKGQNNEKQTYYPSPTSTVRPATTARLSDMALTPKTANALHNIQKTHYVTTYQSNYTGNGSNDVYKLDNYDDILNGGNSNELTLKTTNTFLPSRPVEGRKFKDNHKRRSTIHVPGTDSNLMILRHDKSSSLSKSFDSGFGSVKSDRLTARSVQFNRSVSFSDGHVIKEIPLSDADKENRNSSNSTPYPRTPYPRTPYPRASQSSSVTSTKTIDGRPSTTYPAPTFYNMPSQTENPPLTGTTSPGTTSPAVYQKCFRPRSMNGENSSSKVLESQNWSRSDVHRKFHVSFPDKVPDLRRKPDTRITTNERRHVIPESGAHTYYFRGTDCTLP